jgi:hypothetical protein
MADFFILKSFEMKIEEALRKRGLNTNGVVQKYIDSKVLEYCEPMIPKDTGALIASGKTHTQIGTGQVKYRTVYARRWYYRPAAFQQAPERGNYWFDRMKQKHKQHILTGAKKIASGTG